MMYKCKNCSNITDIERKCSECGGDGCEKCVFFCANCDVWFCGGCRIKKSCVNCSDYICNEHATQYTVLCNTCIGKE